MNKDVSFGSTKWMGFLGVVGGTAIAIGVPWIVLGHAADAGLGGFAATFLPLAGIVGGVMLATVAVFFSLAIPSKVSKG